MGNLLIGKVSTLTEYLSLELKGTVTYNLARNIRFLRVWLCIQISLLLVYLGIINLAQWQRFSYKNLAADKLHYLMVLFI